MRFDLDDIIDRAASSSRSRFPATGDGMDAKLGREFTRQSRDRDAADKIARSKAVPIRYVDDSQTPAVVIPRGVRKP